MVQLDKLALCAVLAVVAAPAMAQQADFKPETLTVKETIDPGPNVLVYQQEWKGAGSIAVFGKDDLAFKGLMASGSMGQMLVSPDGKTAYSQSTFMKRITYGDIEHVVQVYDVAKLTPVKEVSLPAKAAMTLGYQPMFQASADGKFLYVQNGTPAASVTVVDVAKGSVTAEIPTPGCWGIYPSAAGAYKFSTICGTGIFQTYAVTADGAPAGKTDSARIFDVNSDPIFISGVRVGGDLLFASFNGTLYRLSDAEAAVKTVETIKITDGVDGKWAPGGYAMMGYAEKAGVLFVAMHPDAGNGSHKNPAEEIWAYDLKAKKILSRSAVEHVASFAISADEAPVLFGLTEDPKMIRYTSDPKAGFALTKTGEAKVTGFPFVAQVTP
ncbi:amine dehydrogenase [Azospirillum sp. RWY-5-1]|uniref:Amine dehydrogenase n=1 Tax=Azospirillum oleiclasticum TaxID=2735135 RepID=A0ABX2T605_9PROT|nr:amine dehydrogenase [Azospirillum oleiclasticum]NYZ19721.1 amine dehydrogenase [Azospirillum oleiclasticum]